MKYALALILAVISADAQTSIKAAVAIGNKDEVRLGTLTVADNQLDFEGAELLFGLPLDCIEDVQYAGFREKWLSLGIRIDSDFARSYSFLLQPDRTPKAPARLQLLLPPNGDLKAGIALAQALKTRVTAVVAARRPSPSLSPSVPPPGVLTPQPAPKAQEEKKAAAPAAPSQPQVLYSVAAYYLPKKPGMIMRNYGTAGELIVRQDGIGFVYRDPSELTQERRQATQDGAVFLTAESLQSGRIQNQKLLGGQPTMFFVVLRPKEGTEAHTRFRPLMSDEGELWFTVRAVNERNRVSDFLAKLSAQNF